MIAGTKMTHLCVSRIQFIPFFCRGFYLKIQDNQIYKEPREWTNSKFHFDNVPQALLTLFTVATFEGWPRFVHVIYS